MTIEECNVTTRYIVTDNALRTLVALNEFFIVPGSKETDMKKIMTCEQFLMIQSNVWKETKEKFKI